MITHARRSAAIPIFRTSRWDSIVGLGAYGYELAVRAVATLLARQAARARRRGQPEHKFLEGLPAWIFARSKS